MKNESRKAKSILHFRIDQNDISRIEVTAKRLGKKTRTYVRELVLAGLEAA